MVKILFFITFIIFSKISLAIPFTCATPLECYTKGIENINDCENKMENLQSIINSQNEKINDLQTNMTLMASQLQSTISM